MVRREKLSETESEGVSQGEDFIITSRELVTYGICFSGQRDWFGKAGLDMRDFVKNGIAASKLEATGDGIAIRAVKLARERRV